MNRILITGASGNVGQEILKHFKPSKNQLIYTATRDHGLVTGNKLFFDFEDPEGSIPTLESIDTLFLLRPPHISNVKKYFRPIVQFAKNGSVKHVIFLSVQGAEQLPYIPHAKIEKLLMESGLRYTFVRPSYFMQNLTTTLLKDIKEKNQILLPAGKAPFLWVDVSDIGKAVASILTDTGKHVNKAFSITGNELLNFYKVSQLLSEKLSRDIKFISPNLLKFYLNRKKNGMQHMYILVMIMLHYMPRFQKQPEISQDYTTLTSQSPTEMQSFIQQNLDKWKL